MIWQLIVMTCVGLNCSDHVIVSNHKDLVSCEAAMEVKYDKLEAGQAAMCIQRFTPEVQT